MMNSERMVNCYLLQLWIMLPTALTFLQGFPPNLRAYEFVRSIKTVHVRDLSSFQKEKNDHKNHVQYIIQTKTKILQLDVQENLFLRHENVQIFTENNQTNVKHLFENCHYQGKLKDGTAETGRVVLSTCNGLQGIIIDDVMNTTYFISYLPKITKHILYKASDISGSPQIKNHIYTYSAYPSMLNEKTVEHSMRRRRHADLISTKFKYVSMVIVTDKAFFERQNKNIAAVTRYVSALINHVDHIYSQINVRVLLTHLEIWTAKDNLKLTSHTSKNLGLFSDYNQNILIGRYKWKHDNAHLITGIRQQSGLAGLAAVGTLCAGPSVAMSHSWSNNPGLVANTVAHEFGHNFGLYHTAGGSCKCSKSPCLMTEYVSWTPVKAITDCNAKAIDKRCSNGLCTCLNDKPEKVHNGKTCGNGLVEKNEECDCGLASICTNPCCNAITCKLRYGAQCAHGECCKNCKIMARGTICRKAVGECDITEKCNGTSPECLPNIHIGNYIPCENGKSYCHDGICTDSIDDQCKKLWGPNALHGTDECDLQSGNHMNMKGNQWGNCGKNDNGTYIKCLLRDAHCGKVHCFGEKLPSFILFGQNRKTVFFSGKKKKCRSGQTMAGSDIVDPTLAKHGTKCGYNKICHNQQCVDAIVLHDVIGKCHGGCGKNGYCTNTGYCYCSATYKCPDCVGKDLSNVHGQLCKQTIIDKRNANSSKPCGCRNGGVCDSNGICFCQPGFKCPDCGPPDSSNKFGTLCNKKMKKSPQCSTLCYNGGSCNATTNSCICPAGTKCPDCKEKSKENFVGLQCPIVKVTTCNNALKSRLQHVGCRTKLSTKSKAFMLHNFRSSIIWKADGYNLQELACKCASLAFSKGYTYIAMQYWGECWSTNMAEDHVLKYLSLGKNCVTSQYGPCKDNVGDLCAGKNTDSFVYKISR